MPQVRIITTSGSIFEIEAFYEDVKASISVGSQKDFVEFNRLGGGIPIPKVLIRKRDVESIQQINR